MTAQELIKAMKNMENGERIEFLKYLYEEHFCYNKLTDEEIQVLSDYHDGYLEEAGYEAPV